jgi:hypothetical protein
MFFLSFFVVVAIGAIAAAAVLRRDSLAASPRPGNAARTRPVLAANRTSRTIAATVIALLAATIGYLTIAGPSGAAPRLIGTGAPNSTAPAPSSPGPSGVSESISVPVSSPASSSTADGGSMSAPVSGSGSISDESTSAGSSADPSASGGIEGVSASATPTNSSGIDAVSATKPASGTGGLAATGVDVLGGAGAGALAVLLGALILWTARRKGRHSI